MTATVVTAKTRKRCPHCKLMAEKGEEAVLTDDRFQREAYKPHTGGTMTVTRGAWHLWHPACHVEACR